MRGRSGDEQHELLALSPRESEDSKVMDSFNRLNKLAQSQQRKTNTFLKKCWEFFKIVAFNYDNEFEKFVASNEPNDCALVSKFYLVDNIDLRHENNLSVDNVYLNTIHIPHPLINLLKKDHVHIDDNVLKGLKESPILVFIHGLGGQMSQFEPLMGLLSQCLEIVSLDLPGFGNSRHKFKPDFAKLSDISPEDQVKISNSIGQMSDNDFTSDNIANIIVEFINQKIDPQKKIVLIGHSMGSHLSVRVIKKLTQGRVEGLILLSPPKFVNDIDNDTKQLKKNQQRKPIFSKWLLNFPKLVNIFRVWDKLEGLNSKSVLRQVGHIVTNSVHSHTYIKLRQFRWNMDVDTNIVLKYAKGFQSCSNSDLITVINKFNDNPFDTRVYEKTLLIAGDQDLVAPAKEIKNINDMLSQAFQRKVAFTLEIKNAGHSLLLSKPEFISGKILNHIESKFPERLHLSPSWVLRVKADISGDKWGLKNELKWLRLDPISTNIIRLNGTDVAPLLGMKTLRQDDVNHSPSILEDVFYRQKPANYPTPKGQLIAIVDISADIPPYNPDSLTFIKYYKCATVSKVVPDPASIRRFIQLIDDILLSTDKIHQPLIAVHCHYGFNRTGFLICCYLIERLGWTVEQAVEGFRVSKPPGIKHRHFIDALYVKYES